MKISRVWFYSFLFLFLLMADRLSKWYALTSSQFQKLFSFMSCQVTFNRGVAWSFLHFSDDQGFLLVTSLVIVVTLVLCIYTVNQYRLHKNIVGELLVLSGAISNIIDRLLYHGVVDFIVIRCFNAASPIFNIADVWIVLGIGLMMYQIIKQS